MMAEDVAENRLVVSNRGRATWAAFLAGCGQYPDDLTGI
jgi:hypothetical protein